MKRWLVVVAAILLLASCTTLGRWFMLLDTRKLKVGMTRTEVEAVTPLSKHINRTVVEGRSIEQWVFKRGPGSYVYLYLENGILTGWQD